MKTLILSLFFIAPNAFAMDFYLKFNMDQYDNGKSSLVKENWILDCNKRKECSLVQIAILCQPKSAKKDSLILFSHYSTEPKGIVRYMSNLKIDLTKKLIKFDYSQFGGPSKIECEIQYESGVKVKTAHCGGHGEWAAGSKYFREWRNNPKSYYLNDQCSNIIMPN